MTDLEIARSVVPLPIGKVAAKLGIREENLEYYGRTKAKIAPEEFRARKEDPDGKLILVTAINPTPLGEGKTTVSIGLADALARKGKKICLALREPSLGPVFGIKGGAAGGGHAQVIPMEEINLHFTGDFHAITSANNLLAAMIDNHIQQGNAIGIDPRTVMFPRCMDMNDRQLRHLIDGLGGKTDGVPREDKFVITVATEIMAVFCLADGLADLKKRLGDIVIAKHFDGTPVFARELGCAGAMAVLLKDAVKPNLVQTLEGTPALVHGGPFANIAHGCNTVAATKLALKLADYTVTEAGFGADLGAEKFLDIKCRSLKRFPDCVVLVATIRSLKYNGGVPKDQTAVENTEALKKGFANLEHHFKVLTGVYGMNVCVAVNRFPADTEKEIALLKELCADRNMPVSLTEVWAMGGEGGLDLAEKVTAVCEKKTSPRHAYELDLSIREKIEAVVRKVYGGSGIEVSRDAAKEIDFLTQNGFSSLPVCIAKTQYSLTDDPTRLGCPEGFTVSVRTVRVSAGAGFIVVETGTIMTMPGLPKKPAALAIDVSDDGVVTGLF